MRWLVIKFGIRGANEENGPPTFWGNTNVRYILWRLKNGTLTTRTQADLDWQQSCHTVGQAKFPGVCTMNGFIDTTKVNIMRTGYMSIGVGDTRYKSIKFSWPRYRRVNFENPTNADPPDTQLDPALQGEDPTPVGSEKIYLSFVSDRGVVLNAMQTKMYFIDD